MPTPQAHHDHPGIHKWQAVVTVNNIHGRHQQEHFSASPILLPHLLFICNIYLCVCSTAGAGQADSMARLS